MIRFLSTCILLFGFQALTLSQTTAPIDSSAQKDRYNTHRKNGTVTHHFKNGNIAYSATFRNDTMIGDATNYYENGSLKSKGNLQNGRWTEYYENGNIKSISTFVNRKLSGERFYFTPQGDTLLPRAIKPTPVTGDTSIVNQTDLKVYCLFDSKDSINRPISFDVYLFAPVKVCKNELATIHTGNIHFLIKPGGLHIYERPETGCTQSIRTNGYTINRKVTQLPGGEYDVSYLLEKKYFASRLGKIEVERKELQCDDTGHNPIKITKEGKTLLFKDIGNLSFFEYDSDNDGKTELYILNYFSCMGRLKIYRVDDK